MPKVSGASPGAATVELMKVLEQQQAAAIDMAKKLIQLANETKVSSQAAEGKGRVLDLFA